MSTVQKKQTQVEQTTIKKTKLKKGSSKTSKKHRDEPNKIFDDYLLAKEDCKDDINLIEQDSIDCYVQYLKDISFCQTIPDKDDLSHINYKYKRIIGCINHDINCLEVDNSRSLRTIKTQNATQISIFIRKYLIEYQIKCKCPYQACISQYRTGYYGYNTDNGDNDDNDGYYRDVESFINAVTFSDECKSSSCGINDFGNSYHNSYNDYYDYNSDEDGQYQSQSLSEIYSRATNIYQCLCFDTILNYLVQYQHFMSDINKQHIPRIPKVMNLSKLCEINIANMMSIPSLKYTLCTDINNILKIKKLDTYEHITFNNKFDFDKKLKFAKIEKILKALEEYKTDGDIKGLMCINAQQLKIELDTLRKTYYDMVNKCNTKYKNLISSLQKQSKDFFQQRIDEIKHFREKVIDLHTVSNPNFKEYLALETEYIKYICY